MRSVTLSLCVAMAATGILGLACSSSGDSPAAGGTAGVGGATGGTGGFEGGVGGVGGTGGTGGGTGGAAGDGNDTKETATPISIGTDPQNDSVQGSLDPVATDQDWYSFDGTAGMVLSVLTVGKSGTDKFDPTYPDLVVSIHDESGAQIALQDDPDPRTSNDPYLLTVLPSTGKYFVRIVECNAWEQGGAANCAPADGVVNKNYAFFLSEVKFDTDSEILEAEPNDTAANATPITFTPNPNSVGAYYLSLVHGAFSAQTDVDGFSFAIPAGLTVAAGSRAVVNFYPQEPGMNGNGSSTDMGELTIVEASAPAVVIAQVNVAQGGRFSVPLTVGTDYVAFYKRAATPSGAQDFYFDFVGVGSGNPLEQAEATNDDLATAELIPVSATQAGSYFIEGDLVGSDVDHFSVAVPATNADVVSVACGAERSGSGVRGLVATLLDDAGSPVTGGTATESATTDLRITDLAVPAGKTTLVLKLEPTSQSPEVMSTFYRCGVHFRATPTN